MVAVENCRRLERRQYAQRAPVRHRPLRTPSPGGSGRRKSSRRCAATTSWYSSRHASLRTGTARSRSTSFRRQIHDERKRAIDMLVLHYTGMKSADDALARLIDAAAKVSSHYLVYEDGRIDQLVPEARRAWHAGLSSWKGVTDINSCSIGIEIVNPGHEFGYRDFPDVQIDAVIALCRDISARRKIPSDARAGAFRYRACAQAGPRREIPLGARRRRRRRAVGRAIAAASTAQSSSRTIAARRSRSCSACSRASAMRRTSRISTTGRRRRSSLHFSATSVPRAHDGIADRLTFATLQRLLTALPPIA